MIAPAQTCLFIPSGLKNFKLDLFNRIGNKIKAAGGRTIEGDVNKLAELPDEFVPLVGCTPELRFLLEGWRARNRRWIYWDRGYARRVFATYLPRGENGGYYRWHLNSFQMRWVRDVPNDRWAALRTPVAPWSKDGKHIVLAQPTQTYAKFHSCEGWTDRTIAELKGFTDRKLIVRDKESSRSLQEDLKGAHCLVAHGSNAAVEAVILGCPVFVHQDSAAAIVGNTTLNKIEEPIYPDRERWLNSLAYCQFNEAELVDGTLWRLIA